jgi:hypothetical protein
MARLYMQLVSLAGTETGATWALGVFCAGFVLGAR